MIQKILRANLFYNYLRCKHRVYLDFYGDRSKKDPVSDFLELLWARGVQHEKEIAWQLAAKRQLIEVKERNNYQAFEKTLELMSMGVDLIYQGVLLDENYIGKPDILEKRRGQSKFGKYYYLPIEIKSGYGLKNIKAREIKNEYAYQVLFYILLLEKIQGVRPPIGKVINIKKETLIFKPTEKHYADYQEILFDLQKIINQEKSYEPVIGGHCKLCAWRSYCLDWAEKNQDLSLIFNLGEAKYQLRANGVKTIEDLGRADSSKFFAFSHDILGINKASFLAWQRRANVFLGNKEIIYSPIEFPVKKREIFFDLEDDLTQDLVYLYGLWQREVNKEKYIYFLVDNFHSEKDVFYQFWSYLEQLDDFVIYYFAPHERNVLARLMKKYRADKEIFQKFLTNSIDLYQVVCRHTDWPLPSYSLKSIGQYLKFHWSVEDPSGANSIAWYNKFLKDQEKNKAYLERIIKYNQEDCQATAWLKDHLEKMSREISE